MTKLKTGMKVAAVYVPDHAEKWITVNKEYTVMAVQGEKNLCFGDTIRSPYGFNFVDDNGQMAFQAGLTGLHADFEIVE